MSEEDSVCREEFEAPPGGAQLGPTKLLQMSLGSVRQQLVASLLQTATVAATAAFLMFVLGEIVTLRVAADLPTAAADPGGQMAQLYWILAVSLLVCAISNVTSMLFSVTKRFREIGTMKCLGAFDHSILHLFLVEAAILGFSGAVLGVVAGGGLSVVLALGAHGVAVARGGIILPLFAAAGVTLGVVVLLCFLGALYPAWRASRMLPVEAMRKV